MDSWLLLYNREANGEHNRQLYLLKSRGMAHSNQVREFILGSTGVVLRTPYIGPEGVLTGSARMAQEAREKAASLVRRQAIEQRASDLKRDRARTEAQITALRAELESQEAEAKRLIQEAESREALLEQGRQDQQSRRGGSARRE